MTEHTDAETLGQAHHSRSGSSPPSRCGRSSATNTPVSPRLHRAARLSPSLRSSSWHAPLPSRAAYGQEPHMNAVKTYRHLNQNHQPANAPGRRTRQASNISLAAAECQQGIHKFALDSIWLTIDVRGPSHLEDQQAHAGRDSSSTNCNARAPAAMRTRRPARCTVDRSRTCPQPQHARTAHSSLPPSSTCT